jgi:hypothetical protein
MAFWKRLFAGAITATGLLSLVVAAGADWFDLCRV